MKELSSWLITFFIVAFWVFRVIVAVMGTMGSDFIVQPMNLTTEIILTFVVLALVPFIFKRKLNFELEYILIYKYIKFYFLKYILLFLFFDLNFCFTSGI